MSVTFSDFDIEGKFVELFSKSGGATKLVFAGLGEEGRWLQSILKEFKKGRVTQIADNLTFQNSGLWLIEEIEFTKESNVYRVKMTLKPTKL